jgi:hypothetical protein
MERRGFKRSPLGSVIETAWQETPCPALTVSPDTEAASVDVATSKQIVDLIGFSPSALQAQRFALDLALKAVRWR